MRLAAAVLLAALAAGPARARALPQDLRCPGCSVLLVTIDLLRADLLAAQGAGRRAVPNLDALARRGALFLNAYAPSAQSQPAEVSLLTGLYPRRHGLTRPLRDQDQLDLWLESPAGLSSILRARGYRVSRASLPPPREPGQPSAGTPAVLEGIEPGRKFFLWVNERVHDPYLPPWSAVQALDPAASKDDLPDLGDVFRCMMASLMSRRAPAGFDGFLRPPEEELFRLRRQEDEAPLILSHPDPGERLRAARRFKPLAANYLLASQCYWSFFSSATVAGARLMYEAKARSIDERLGLLFEELGARRVLDKTLIVITSQHGEEFLEHGQVGHTQLHREMVRVPLVVLFPESRPSRVVSDPVSTVDVMPTVLEALGVPVPGGLDGKSLLGCLDGGCPGRLAFSEWDGKGAVRDGRYSYLRGADGTEALYDLGADPEERRDIALREPEALARLREALLRMSRRGPDADAPARAAEKARQEVLRKGYW